MIENKLSNGLAKLLGQKDVAHFAKSMNRIPSEIERINYFRQFEQAQVAEIAEFGTSKRRF